MTEGGAAVGTDPAPAAEEEKAVAVAPVKESAPAGEEEVYNVREGNSSSTAAPTAEVARGNSCRVESSSSSNGRMNGM